MAVIAEPHLPAGARVDLPVSGTEDVVQGIRERKIEAVVGGGAHAYFVHAVEAGYVLAGGRQVVDESGVQAAARTQPVPCSEFHARKRERLTEDAEILVPVEYVVFYVTDGPIGFQKDGGSPAAVFVDREEVQVPVAGGHGPHEQGLFVENVIGSGKDAQFELSRVYGYAGKDGRCGEFAAIGTGFGTRALRRRGYGRRRRGAGRENAGRHRFPSAFAGYDPDLVP